MSTVTGRPLSSSQTHNERKDSVRIFYSREKMKKALHREFHGVDALDFIMGWEEQSNSKEMEFSAVGGIAHQTPRKVFGYLTRIMRVLQNVKLLIYSALSVVCLILRTFFGCPYICSIITGNEAKYHQQISRCF